MYVLKLCLCRGYSGVFFFFFCWLFFFPLSWVCAWVQWSCWSLQESGAPLPGNCRLKCTSSCLDPQREMRQMEPSSLNAVFPPQSEAADIKQSRAGQGMICMVVIVLTVSVPFVLFCHNSWFTFFFSVLLALRHYKVISSVLKNEYQNVLHIKGCFQLVETLRKGYRTSGKSRRWKKAEWVAFFSR